ncbi:MAG TPA: O-antigen ligase family protein [Coleofasciculaceae cyanobacterium]|jgi:hypothetical protein
MSNISEARFQSPLFRPDTFWQWLILPALGLLMPLCVYILLPQMGINALANALDFKKLLMLSGAIIGGVGYLLYFRFAISRPQLLVAFMVLAWPLVDYLNGQLLNAGINIHLRPLLLLTLALPALWISIRHARLLWTELPWLKAYLVFFGWLMLYVVFNNANAVDPRMSSGEESLSEGSVSLIQLFSYFYCLMGITVSAVSILRLRNYRGLFDTFNRALLWVSSFESVLTIAGYPFGLFNMLLDGFTRAIGIFSHPNPFAHHMGVLMVYLLGLFCYYQAERKQRMPGWLLMGGITLNFVAFLLGLSKTALATFAICSALLFLMNLAVPAVRRSFLRILAVLAVLVPVGLWAFEALSGENFSSLLESRITDTKSMDWRTQVWEDLIAEINGVTMWLGHGFTAANATVFRLTFNDAKNAQPLMMVHNAYIALIYDLGIMGYTLFLAAATLIWGALQGWITALRPALRTENSIIIALAVYFLAVCGFDEMSYMFDAPMLFWILATLLYCINRREQREAAASGNPTELNSPEVVPASLDELWANRLDSTDFWGTGFSDPDRGDRP